MNNKYIEKLDRLQNMPYLVDKKSPKYQPRKSQLNPAFPQMDKTEVLQKQWSRQNSRQMESKNLNERSYNQLNARGLNEEAKVVESTLDNNSSQIFKFNKLNEQYQLLLGSYKKLKESNGILESKNAAQGETIQQLLQEISLLKRTQENLEHSLEMAKLKNLK